MPYGIVALCYIFGGEGFVNPLIVVIPLLASKSSVCWNPMLYIVMNFQVRLKPQSKYPVLHLGAFGGTEFLFLGRMGQYIKY